MRSGSCPSDGTGGADLYDPLEQSEELLLFVAGQGRKQGIGGVVGGDLDLVDRPLTASSEFEFVKPTVSRSPPAPDQPVAFEFVGG